MKAAGPVDPKLIPLAHIDVSNPRLYQDDVIGAYFARLRKEAPIHYCANSHYGPFWSLTTYKDIVEINADDVRVSSNYELGGHILGYDTMFRCHGVDARMFQSTDPPIHTAQRKAIAPIVARANVREMEDKIRAICARILDALPLGETFDWVECVSIEMTSQVLAMLFDFPQEKRRMLTRWSDIAVSEPGFGIVDSWQSRRLELEDCFTTFAGLWQERLQGEPRSDLLSLMVHAEGTKNLSPGEFLGNLINLIVGGNDTTRNSLSGGVFALNRYPAQYDKLRADRALIDTMVPEIIRWQTPISHMARTAVQDFRLGEAKIKRGDRIAMWYISGNRDEDAIAMPEAFVIDRANPRRHLSFGFGTHHCVGYRLAELQLQIAWEEIMQRFSMVEMVGEPTRVCSNVIHGYTAMPVRLHA